MLLFRRTPSPCRSRRGYFFGHHRWGWIRNRSGEYLGQETEGETFSIGRREWVRGCMWCRTIHPELSALDSAVIPLISRGLVRDGKLPRDFDLLHESFRGRRNGSQVESSVSQDKLTPEIIAHARELAGLPPGGIETATA